MKWFDEILGELPAAEDAEEVSISNVINGEVMSGSADGHVRARSGEQIAKVEPSVSLTGFEISFRLVVPTDMWENTEVICDGNSTEVVTEPMGNGRYKVKRKLRGYRPAVMEREDTIELREFETTKQFIEWIETLSTDDIEALRQIYYDMWNFDNNSTKNRMYYELLEEEKAGRRK